MKRAEVKLQIALESQRPIADLRSLSPDRWNHASLCDGWTIREVVGHLIAVADYHTHWSNRTNSFIRGLVRSGFRLNRFIAADATSRTAGRTTLQLVSDLEHALTRVGHPFPIYTLSEVVIHAQDIRRPLGIPHSTPRESLCAVADLSRSFSLLRYAFSRGWRTRGFRYEASDTNWVVGRGQVVRAPIEALVMVLSGRRVDRTELSGEGADALPERAYT